MWRGEFLTNQIMYRAGQQNRRAAASELHVLWTVEADKHPEENGYCGVYDPSPTADEYSDYYSVIGVYTGKDKLMAAVQKHHEDNPPRFPRKYEHLYFVDSMQPDADPRPNDDATNIPVVIGFIDEIRLWSGRDPHAFRHLAASRIQRAWRVCRVGVPLALQLRSGCAADAIDPRGRLS